MEMSGLSRGFSICCLRFKNGVATTPARLASGWLARVYCGCLRFRSGIRIDCGQAFQYIADSIPMIADSSPTDGFEGSLGVVCVKLAPLAGFFRWLAQGLAVEHEAMRGVHQAVEDGIGDCRIDDELVPMIDGELTGHDRRAAAVAIVDDFEQVAALL